MAGLLYLDGAGVVVPAQIVGAMRGYVWRNWVETASPLLGWLAVGLVWLALREILPATWLGGRAGWWGAHSSSQWPEHLLDIAANSANRRR